MQATHVGGRLSTKMDRGGGEKLVSTRWRPKCICASVHLCLRIEDEAGLFAGALSLELGGYGDESTAILHLPRACPD